MNQKCIYFLFEHNLDDIFYVRGFLSQRKDYKYEKSCK